MTVRVRVGVRVTVRVRVMVGVRVIVQVRVIVRLPRVGVRVRVTSGAGGGLAGRRVCRRPRARDRGTRVLVGVKPARRHGWHHDHGENQQGPAELPCRGFLSGT